MARKNHRRNPAKAEASFPLIRDGPYGMRMRSDHIYQCEAILTRQGQPRNAAHQGDGNSSQLSFSYPRHPTNDEGEVYWKEGTKIRAHLPHSARPAPDPSRSPHPTLDSWLEDSTVSHPTLRPATRGRNHATVPVDHGRERPDRNLPRTNL